jgi:hypothetical protein
VVRIQQLTCLCHSNASIKTDYTFCWYGPKQEVETQLLAQTIHIKLHRNPNGLRDWNMWTSEQAGASHYEIARCSESIPRFHSQAMWKKSAFVLWCFSEHRYGRDMETITLFVLLSSFLSSPHPPVYKPTSFSLGSSSAHYSCSTCGTRAACSPGEYPSIPEICVNPLKTELLIIRVYTNSVRTAQETLRLRYKAQPVNAV